MRHCQRQRLITRQMEGLFAPATDGTVPLIKSGLENRGHSWCTDERDEEINIGWMHCLDPNCDAKRTESPSKRSIAQMQQEEAFHLYGPDRPRESSATASIGFSTLESTRIPYLFRITHFLSSYCVCRSRSLQRGMHSSRQICCALK